jgi:tRNA G18 (ribose-2'-O)-methylase SpoU
VGLKQQGYTLLAIEQVEGAIMLDQLTIDSTKRYALVFGNEVAGVDQAVVDICDGAIEIPQVGTKHSINVSVAGGVVLWPFFAELKTML